MMEHSLNERWGIWFVLAMPEDSLKVDGKTFTVTEPTLLPRIGRSVSLNRKTFDSISLPLRDVITGVVTDRKIYRPEDLVYAFVAAPYLPNEQVKLELRYLNRPLLTEMLTLDKYGVALTTFEGLEIGSHTLRLTSRDGQNLGETDFEVAEFSLMPLTVRLTSVRWEQERCLDLQVQVLRLDEPYQGRLKVELLTRYLGDDWETLFGAEMPCAEGILPLRFWILWWKKELALRVQTPDGETALVPIPFSDWRSRYDVTLSEMGRVWKGRTTPKTGAQLAHGVFVWSEDIKTSPLHLHHAVASKATFTTQHDIAHLVIVAVDNVRQKHQIHEWRNLGAGEKVEVPIAKPYTLLLVGALKSDCWFEGKAVVIHPDELSLKVRLPEQARPGQTITVTLKSNKPCKCFLVVHDARLSYDRIEQKMSEQMITALRNTQSWASWYRHEWEERRRWLGQKRFFLARAELKEVGFEPSVDSLLMPIPTSSKEVVTETPAAAPKPPRSYFPEVAYCGLVDVDGETKVNFVIGEQIGEWVVRAFAVAEGDWTHTEQTLTVSKPAYLEADLPAIASEEDETIVRILYRTPRPSRILITTPTERVEQLVEALGELTVPIKGYGKVTGEIVAIDDPNISDAFEREVMKSGTARVLSSSLHWLLTGEVVEGEMLTVYPSPLYLVEQLVWSLVDYPFG